MTAVVMKTSTRWIEKPKGFPSSLYVHKRGWAARVGGKNPKVIAGRIPPDEALINNVNYPTAHLLLADVLEQKTLALSGRNTDDESELINEILASVPRSCTATIARMLTDSWDN